MSLDPPPMPKVSRCYAEGCPCMEWEEGEAATQPPTPEPTGWIGGYGWWIPA